MEQQQQPLPTDNTKLRGSNIATQAKTRLLEAFAAEKKAMSEQQLIAKRASLRVPPKIPQRLAWRYTVLEALEPGVVPISLAPTCKAFDNFKVTDSVLGRGGYGTTYRACYEKNCQEGDEKAYKYAAKFVQLTEDTQRAFRMEAILCLLAGENKWGPKIVSVFLCDRNQYGVIVMELLRPLKKEDLRMENVPRLKNFLKRMNDMHLAGILHGDLYTKNVMVHPETQELLVIDFGLALVTESAVPGSLRASDIVCFLYGMPYPYVSPPAVPSPATSGLSVLAHMATPRRLNELAAKPAFTDVQVLITLLQFYMSKFLQNNVAAMIQGAQMRIAETISTIDDLMVLVPKGPYSCRVQLYYQLILDAIPAELATVILTPTGLMDKFPWIAFTLDPTVEAATWRMINQRLAVITQEAPKETLESMPVAAAPTTEYTLLKTLETIPIASSASCARFSDLKISNRMLGAGAYGATFQACYEANGAAADCKEFKYAAKFVLIQNASEELAFRLEGLLAMYAGNKGWGPRVVSFFLCQNNQKGVMVMELMRPINTAVDLQSSERLQSFLQRMNEMHEAGILHGDLYLRNLMVHPVSGELMMVDFGLALPLRGPVPWSLRASDFGSLTYGMPMPWNNSVPATERLMRLENGLANLLQPSKRYAEFAKYYLRVVMRNNKAAFAEGIRMRVNTQVDLATDATNPPGPPPYNCDVFRYYQAILQNLTPTLRTDILDPKALEAKFVYMSFTRDQETWTRTYNMVKTYLTTGAVVVAITG